MAVPEAATGLAQVPDQAGIGTGVALLFLEPGQGLAGVAPEQPIVLAAASIEYGQWRRHMPTCAAGLLLLHGLALLASFFIFLAH